MVDQNENQFFHSCMLDVFGKVKCYFSGQFCSDGEIMSEDALKFTILPPIEDYVAGMLSKLRNCRQRHVSSEALDILWGGYKTPQYAKVQGLNTEQGNILFNAVRESILSNFEKKTVLLSDEKKYFVQSNAGGLDFILEN